MTISIVPLIPGKSLAAQVHGADLLRGLSDTDFSSVAAALDVYPVLVFRGQQSSNGHLVGEEEQLRFARQFGPLDHAYLPKSAIREGAKSAHYGEVSNIGENGEVWSENDRRRWFLMANYFWHSDTSYKTIPTWVTILSAHEVPPVDGHTQFADMRAAWNSLPQELRTLIEPLTAEHSVFHSRGLTGFTDFSAEDRAAAPPAIQPLVRTNPRTAGKSLYLSAHASHIVGWPAEKGQRLLHDLTERATTPDNVYSHDWKVGDVVVWDNSTTMHRATAYDEFRYRRVLKRTSVNEKLPVSTSDVSR